jgi:hypothetical protein
LPNIKELQSLNDESLSNRPWIKLFFASIEWKIIEFNTVQIKHLMLFWNTEFE